MKEVIFYYFENFKLLLFLNQLLQLLLKYYQPKLVLHVKTIVICRKFGHYELIIRIGRKNFKESIERQVRLLNFLDVF